MAFRTFFPSAVLLALTGWLSTTPACAQISYSSPAQQRAENRRALRDARRVQTPYQESHLAVTRETFKDGDSGNQKARPNDGREKYKFDHEGIPRVSVPMSAMLPTHWLRIPPKQLKKPTTTP
ncbi:hypothetical protein [Hymenobacter sp. BT730]|uniref:hypothetical protein n=1 Tax=Hymenobacter sp. BT730 TaxID=3063332 RepID=UPI0026DED998|nr:hypothetical protein [Hymenobacter sp. BT730]